MLIAIVAALAASAPQCPPVEVTVAAADMPASFGTPSVQEVSETFAQAYERACAQGLLKTNPLVPGDSKAHGRIFLFNAPQANVASIYTAEDGRTVLEYYFVTEDGKTNIPLADEVDEAIYCAVIGATEAEQEERGRCLPD